jgi:cobalt-zinc-cadmium efflux system outer membrane protein
MRQLLCLCIALFAVVFANPVAAQQALTEAEAVGRVSLESPRARSIRAQVDVVRADVLAASRWPNPRVTLSRESVSGVAENYLLVSQPLPITGRRRLEAESASQDVRAAELRADDMLRRLRADARRAFVALSVEETRMRLLDESLAELQSLAGVLAKREAGGDVAGFDRLRAERETLEVAAAVADARVARVRAQGALAGLFYPTPDPETLHAAPLSVLRSPLPPADELVARAEATRSDLAAFDRDAEAARLAREAAVRSRLPEPEVVAGLKTSNVGDNRRGSVLSLVASIPLFDRARPERARAEALERLATAEHEALRAEIGATVRALRRAAAERRSAADDYRTTTLAKSDELRRIAQVSYDAGERGILELLDAFRSAADARLRVAELDAAVAHAEIDLELATAVEIRK